MSIINDNELNNSLRTKNLVLQYDLLTSCIEIIAKKGIIHFDKYMLWSLNHVALANIVDHAGRFREQPVFINQHTPPSFKDVPHLMDLFFSWIYSIWDKTENNFIAPAYALWRLNWIHPFIDGNGRTARAICYLLICAKFNQILPGSKILPELLKENSQDLVCILAKLDQSWDDGQQQGSVHLYELADFLAKLITQQVNSVPQ